MKCLVILAGLFMHKQSMVVLPGSSCMWPGLLRDRMTRQNQNLTLKTLLVSPQRTVSFPPGLPSSYLTECQPFARILAGGSSHRPLSGEPESVTVAPLSVSALDLWSCLAEWGGKVMGKLVAVVV